MLQVIYNNNIRVIGVPMPLKLKITADLTLDNPAYEKAKRQKRPTWGMDQKLRLYLQDGAALVLPRGYGPQLRQHLKDLSLSADDRTDFTEGAEVDFGTWNPAYTLRDYQDAAVTAMLRRNGVVVAPAGSGKTVIGMRYIHQLQRPTLWLTHTTDLMHQAKGAAEATLGSVGRIGLLGDGNKDWGDGKLIIATVQTLSSNPAYIDALNPLIGAVVIDEAHHFPATQFLDTVAKLKALRIVGVTATPDRKDHLEPYMYLGIGPKLYEVDRTALYSDTQLIKPTVRFIYTDFADDPASYADGTTVDMGGEDLDYNDLLNKLMADEDRIQLVAKTIVDAVPLGPAIVIAESVRYCFLLRSAVRKRWAALYGKRKLRTAVVHGGLQRNVWRVAGTEGEAKRLAAQYGTKYRYNENARRWQVQTPQYTEDEYKAWQVTQKERKEYIQAAKDGQLDILFATQLAREGLDIPRLCVGHCVTPKRGDDHKSRTGAALEQEIGRIMRPDPGNPDKAAYWYDYVDNRVGVFQAQYYSRRRVYKRLGLVVPKKPKTPTDQDLVESLLNDIQY